MNLTENEKKSILELHGQGLSQNAISRELTIPKPYVNAVIRSNSKLHGITGNLPVNLPKPIPTFTDNSSENYYLKKQITDLEDRIKELKQDLNTTKTNFEVLQKKHVLLEVDHATIENRHKLELERKDIQIAASGKSALNGIVDPILTPFTKNDKFMEALGNGIAKFATDKIMGGGNAEQQNLPNNSHPQIADPEVAKFMAEIPAALAAFDKPKLAKLYELIGLFLAPQFPDLLDNVHLQVTNHLQAANNQ